MRVIWVVLLVVLVNGGIAQQGTAEEIAKLKRIIAEQDRRIARLEATVKQLQSAIQRLGVVEPSQSTKPQATTPTTGKSPWKNPANWDRIKDGMSKAQVTAILGQPTSSEEMGVLTLFYEGEVQGSGFVSGNVKLIDNRVHRTNKPVF